MKPLIKNLIYMILLLAITFDLFTCKDFKITSDDESELMDAIEELNTNGGKIFINTTVINIKREINITGDFRGGIFGIRQDSGEYPRIHFLNKAGSNSGINIIGSKKDLQFIIIENAQGNGISIFGDYNSLSHVVSRYNYGSGIVVYGDYSTLYFCYSYRNCDATLKSVNADGFLIYGKEDNLLDHCYAWDNANSGFNYVRIKNYSEIKFLDCGSWNNGNIDVFTGKYDYDLGNTLDKNLWTIQAIMKSDLDFSRTFYNKQYNIHYAKIDGISVEEWIAKVEPKMDGNGFVFGNQNSSQSTDIIFNVFYCATFDNKNGGFIDNYKHKYNIIMEECASFNNYINYKLPYTFSKWEK